METAIELREIINENEEKNDNCERKSVRKNNYIFELIMWKNICKKILNPSF